MTALQDGLRAEEHVTRPEFALSIRALTDQDHAIHEILTNRSVIEDTMRLQHARGLPSRFSDWVLIHPILWAVGSGFVLVVLGLAVNLAPVLIVASGAAVAVLNIRHAKKRGYCPLPAKPVSPGCAEAE